MLHHINEYKEEIIRVRHRIDEMIHRTPVLTSRQINQRVGGQVFFKCENFQRMGAFKMRGAANAIKCLDEKDQKKGVVTHSSGNFAQAVSLAAQTMGIPAFIVMPENAPKVKVDAVRGYQGQVTLCPSTLEDREANAQRIVKEKGCTFLHPSNQIEVILGQGTAAMELLDEVGPLDAIIVPVGGGGLLAGTGIGTLAQSSKAKIFGAEPEKVDDARRSLLSGKIEGNSRIDTIADGLRTTLGNVNFPIIQHCTTDIFTVSEEEIIQTMKLVWERMKIIIEPSSAVPLAALLKHRSHFKDKKIGCVISGGNVDLANLPF